MQPPGKSVFFNDRLGYLFVKATESDLDTIERAIQVLNQVPPQVHIKARFIEVQENDSKPGLRLVSRPVQMGKQAVAKGGTPVADGAGLGGQSDGRFPRQLHRWPTCALRPTSYFRGLPRQGGSTLATITGILTDPISSVALHALDQPRR